ncbi:MAG TPA: UDP-N-acetylglucosamine 1-carboxyvinyltransferase, partial [Dictyoglomaceae bacterium]|nr:UDP-N-acetylglucosamine 1-carboxyvinyltransferase [Dictyoglomaceae bacterium]
MSKDKFVIEGGHKLRGDIEIWGSKNASLPIMAASILNTGELTLDNVSPVKDNIIMAEILKVLGLDVRFLAGDKVFIKGEP